MAPPFEYLLATTVEGEILDEVPFGTLTFTAGLNAPGGWSAGGLSVHHPTAALLLDEAAPWARAIYVVRGGVVHFGGPLIVPEADTEQGEVTAGGQGLLAYYRDGRRSVRGRLGMTYAGTVPKGNVAWSAVRTDRIAGDLIDHAHAYAGGALPLTVDVVDGTDFPTADVVLNGYERKGIGELLDELAAIEPGFAYFVTHAFDTSDPPRLVSTLHLRPNTGPVAGVGTVLELGRNATVAGLTIDGEPIANDVTAVGQGQGDAMLVEVVADGASMYPATDTPRLEAVLNLSDVKTRATLRTLAGGELALRKRAAKVLRLTVKEDADAQLGAFRPGDDVLVTGAWGAIDLAGLWRVLTLSATIDAESSATMTLELVPAYVFDPL